MSVLLEALKKAAEEKKKKGSSVVGDNTTLNHSAESANSHSSQAKENATEHSSDSNNSVGSKQSNLALNSESSRAENHGDKNETSSLSLKLSPKQSEAERSDLSDVEDEKTPLQSSAVLTAAEVELDSDFESKRSPEEIEEFISPSFLKDDRVPTPEPTQPKPAIHISENDEDLLAEATTSFDEEILSTQPEKLLLNNTVQVDENDIHSQTALPETTTSAESSVVVGAKDIEELPDKHAEQSKDVDESYNWSMNDLPGYDDIETPQSTSEPEKPLNVQNNATLDESSLAENPVLTKGTNRQVHLASKKPFKLNPRFLIYVGVFGLFIGIFFYSVVYFQNQNQALEDSFKKYQITRIEPSAALLAKNRESLPAGKEVTSLEKNKIEDSPLADINTGIKEKTSDSVPEKKAVEDAINKIGNSQSADNQQNMIVDADIKSDSILDEVQQKSVSPTENIKAQAKTDSNKAAINPHERRVKPVTIQKTQGLSPEKQKLKAAYQAYQQEKWALAQLFFNEAVELNPENINAQLGLAGSLLNQQKLKDALNVYYQVLDASPINIYAIEGIASIMQQFPSQDKQWQKTLSKVLKDHPDSAFLKSAMGNILAQQNDWQEAQNYYFEALSLEPNNAMYNYNLAISLDYLKQYSLAIEYYTKALLYKNNQSNLDEAAIKTRLAALRLFMEKGDF